MLNYKLSRDDMVATQLDRRGIQDPHVLDVMRRVKRHHFVEPAFQDRAYEDTPLPIEEGQTISQPYIVARMTSLLELKPSDRVLEIGTGSGYQTAVLSELAEKVYTIERHAKLAKKARARLDSEGYSNIVSKCGDGTIGWNEFAPFDKILVTASSPTFPATIFSQLKEGGIMILPVGEQQKQSLLVVTKENGEPVIHDAGQVSFVPLIGREGWTDPSEDGRFYMSGRSAVR